MRAVILAAGYDGRLRPHVDRAPKALVEVGGQPLLVRTLSLLARAGIDQVALVIGHLGAQIREVVAARCPDLDVTFIENPAYATTSTAASLALARPHADGHAFLLLDGDLVFDAGVVARLLDIGPDAVAVRSVGALGAEEVKVHADAHDHVVALGKDLAVRGAMGEAIGMTLVSAATSRRLFAALAAGPDPAAYYEATLQQLVDGGATLHAVDIGSLYACEIDTPDDLRDADAYLRGRPAAAPRSPFRLAV